MFPGQILAFLAVYGVLAVQPPPPLDVGPGLEALREGRFEQARVWFDRLAEEQPGSPEGPFFQAFHLWWRLLEEPDNEDDLRLAMEERLHEAAGRAQGLETAGAAAGDRERGLVFSGVSMLLEAQSLAARGAHWKAAGAARRGHKALSQALRVNPESADALFGLGAYDYYADKVSFLVKGLRVILFIPGGNDKRGIERLERAAQDSDIFGTESLMLLAHIFSGGFEEDYHRALDYTSEALGRHAASPLIRLAHADLLYETGRLREASRQAGEAFALLDGEKSHPAEMRRFAVMRLAECDLALKNPAGALERIERALGSSLPDAPEERREWAGLVTEAAARAGRWDRMEFWADRLEVPPGDLEKLQRRATAVRGDLAALERAAALALLAEGRRSEALAELRRLAERYPLDGRLQYDLGRLLQIEGELTQAQPHLERAVDTPRPEIAGWALLRLGWGLEAQGRREEAVAMYKRAERLRHFRFEVEARMRAARSGLDQPEG